MRTTISPFRSALPTSKMKAPMFTVVALAGMLRRAMAVAEALDEENISVEVIDPRTIVPLDTRTILDSVLRRPAGWS